MILKNKIFYCALGVAIMPQLQALQLNRITSAGCRVIANNIINTEVSSAAQKQKYVTALIRTLTSQYYTALQAINKGNTVLANCILLEQAAVLEEQLKKEIGDHLFEAIQEKCHQKALNEFNQSHIQT